MPSPIPRHGAGTTGRPGLIDTSVAADPGTAELAGAAIRPAVSTLTIAELAGGPAAAEHDFERARREQRLRQVESGVTVLPFNLGCAHAYASVHEVVSRLGRKPRGSRAVDLMIAATALAHELPLYTLNARDLRGLESLIEIVDLGSKVVT